MCSTRRATLSVVLAALVILPLNAYAAPLYSKDVFCNTSKCGTMEFDKYETYTANTAFPSKNWLGGVLINGTFTQERAANYHYVQSYKTDADDLRWIVDDSVALPQPLLDPPPGGYKVRADATDNAYTGKPQKWDYLPWYDEAGEFPGFYDRPTNFFLDAKNQPDKMVTTTFETWLVCVIEETLGPNPEQAKDDSYKVAPLLGWQWGFDLVYKDVGTIGEDELADFTVTMKKFDFVNAPTAHWTDALTAKYGKTTQDFWNITTGPCDTCASVPEPATALLVLIGMPAVALRRWRRDRRCAGSDSRSNH
jgi:hypothetical protein